MNPDDRTAIIEAVFSYRATAPITIEDVRMAAALDGHSLRHIESWQIAIVLRDVAVCESNPYCHRGHWFRRAEA